MIRLEEAAMFGFCVYGLYVFHAQWWWYILILIGPDISFVGYVLGNHAGAGLYNSFHHKGLALFVFLIGYVTDTVELQLVGIMLFGHASMDRMFGYGLKLNRGFKYTHLGVIGGKKSSS